MSEKRRTRTGWGVGLAMTLATSAGGYACADATPTTDEAPLDETSQGYMMGGGGMMPCPTLTGITVNPAQSYVGEMPSATASVMNGVPASVNWTFVITPGPNSTRVGRTETRSGGTTQTVPSDVAGSVAITATIPATPACPASTANTTTTIGHYSVTGLSGDPGFLLRIGTLAAWTATLSPARPTIAANALKWEIRTIAADGTLGPWELLGGAVGGIGTVTDWCASRIGKFRVRVSLDSGGQYSEVVQDGEVFPKKEGVYTYPYVDHWLDPATPGGLKTWANLSFKFAYPPLNVRLCAPPIVDIRVEAVRAFSYPAPLTSIQGQEYLEFGNVAAAGPELIRRNSPAARVGATTLTPTESEPNPFYLPDWEDQGRFDPLSRTPTFTKKAEGGFSVSLMGATSPWDGEINIGNMLAMGAPAGQPANYWATHVLAQFRFTMAWAWSPDGKLTSFTVPSRSYAQALGITTMNATAPTRTPVP